MTKGVWWLLLALTSCGGEDLALPASLTQPPPPSIRRWLLCEECTAGELDSVRALGDSAVDALAAALRGPSNEDVKGMRRQLRAMYLRTPGISIDSNEYVEHYLANFTALYQQRAAVALDSIDTPRADSALAEALRRSGYRDDVMGVLGRAVGTVVLPDSGAFQHGALDSFVRVNPTVLARRSSSGRGVTGIRVRFRVDSGGGQVSADTVVTDSSGRASVKWRLGATDSVNLLTALAAGTAVRFRALAHPVGLRLVFTAQPREVLDGERMTPPVRIAIQDAWGNAQTGLNDPNGIQVVVEGTPFVAAINVVNGVAELTDFRFHGRGTGRRIVARRSHLPVAFSETFTIR